MPPFLLFALVVILFELTQLIMAERYLGVKQIGTDTDPRTLPLGELTAFCWSAGILLSWAWTLGLLFQPYGRLQGLAMILVTTVGYIARRGSALKWTLVILTLEGALRIGMILSVFGAYFFMRGGGGPR